MNLFRRGVDKHVEKHQNQWWLFWIKLREEAKKGYYFLNMGGGGERDGEEERNELVAQLLDASINHLISMSKRVRGSGLDESITDATDSDSKFGIRPSQITPLTNSYDVHKDV